MMWRSSTRREHQDGYPVQGKNQWFAWFAKNSCSSFIPHSYTFLLKESSLGVVSVWEIATAKHEGTWNLAYFQGTDWNCWIFFSPKSPGRNLREPRSRVPFREIGWLNAWPGAVAFGLLLGMDSCSRVSGHRFIDRWIGFLGVTLQYPSFGCINRLSRIY